MKNGGNRGLIFATVNDFAVKKYLEGEINFGEIYNLIFQHYFEIKKKEILSLEDLRYNQNQILDYLKKFNMTYIVGTLILFLVLVTFHEYGHYSVARFFKIKVLKFSIGFGRDLYNWTNKDGVKFSLSMIPLGGYVAFHDPNDPDNYNKLTTEEKKYVLANRPSYEKALVILAGPIFNFVLALFTFILVGLFMPKESDLVSAKIDKFDDDKIYRVVSVNDNPIKNAQDFEIKLLDLTGLTGEVRIGLFDYETKKSVEFIENVENLKFDQEQAPSSYFSISSSVDYLPRIGFINEGSIADLAGLKKGDIILEVNSNKVFSIYQTIELIE